MAADAGGASLVVSGSPLTISFSACLLAANLLAPINFVRRYRKLLWLRDKAFAVNIFEYLQLVIFSVTVTGIATAPI